MRKKCCQCDRFIILFNFAFLVIRDWVFFQTFIAHIFLRFNHVIFINDRHSPWLGLFVFSASDFGSHRLVLHWIRRGPRNNMLTTHINHSALCNLWILVHYILWFFNNSKSFKGKIILIYKGKVILTCVRLFR